MARARLQLIALLLVVALLLVLPGATAADPPPTAPPAAALNKHDWCPMVQGTGVTVVENSPHLLEVALAPSAADHPEAKSFRAGAVGRDVLKGDFDIQVDFDLLDWPEGNGVRVGLLTTLGDVERTGRGTDDFAGTAGEVYATNFLNEVTLTATQDRRGSLRLVRQGDRITGYALQSGEWKALGSAVVPLGDCVVPSDCVVFSLFVWSHNDLFTHQAVSVAFDHFLINSGTLVRNPGPLVAPHSGPGVRPVTE